MAANDILIFAGQPFSEAFKRWTWSTKDGNILTPIDLTGCTAELLIGTGFAAAAPVASWTTANGKLLIPTPLEGIVAPNATAADTKALQVAFAPGNTDEYTYQGRETWLLGPYDLKVTSAGGIPRFMLQGVARLVPEVLTP